MHNPDAQDGSHAQVARARARTSVPRSGPSPQPDPDSTTDSVRSALDVARQRWSANPTEESPATPPQTAGLANSPASATPETDPGAQNPPRLAPVDHPHPFNSWSNWSQPVREVWRTYCDGARNVKEFSPILVLPYWGVGLPLFVIHSTCRLGQDSTTSVNRGVVFVIVVVILIVGIVIALSL